MTKEEDGGKLSRRAVIVGAAVGAAALGGAGKAAAQPARVGRARKPDPRTAHPQPPFTPQNQPFPGLAGRMRPRPDHGEESYVGSGRLSGLRALITGGDSGMGRAAAIAYAREGADVAIAHLPEEEPDAREVVALIEAAGRRGVGVVGDIRTEGVCRRIVAEAVAALGGLDILVNNAGTQTVQRRLEGISSEQFDRVMKTNVYGPFWITKAALPHLGPGSSIIMTASSQAFDPNEDQVDYSMTKAANVNFAKSLAKQLAPRGIRVNAVAPGSVWTPLTVSQGRTDASYVEFGASNPMKRPGQPAELASIYVQLADPTASYSSGQVFGATGANGSV